MLGRSMAEGKRIISNESPRLETRDFTAVMEEGTFNLNLLPISSTPILLTSMTFLLGKATSLSPKRNDLSGTLE